MRALFRAALALALVAPVGAWAQGGLPPFMQSMERHPMTVKVEVWQPGGATKPAPAGLPVAIEIIAGGSKISSYTATTDAAGEATFAAVPSNPQMQGSITYALHVDHQGVRFPFSLTGSPGEGARATVTVTDVTTGLETVEIEHGAIELFPDEESLVVRHQINLYNTGTKAVDLGAQPGGGLKLPCPAGAKHPELHDEHDPMAEVRGTDLFFKGALLPGGLGAPASVQLVYTLPYEDSSYTWEQVMPVPTRGALVIAPQGRQRNQKVAVPLELQTVGAFGAVSVSDQGPDRTFAVLRSNGARLKAGEPLRFAIHNIPAPSHIGRWATLGALAAVFGLVFLGFKRHAGGEARLSRAHLVAERDRLVRALARMRRAVERGKMSQTRFEREREAITARLVSLYKALDRLESR
jgi:hypothetical protein